jgi:polar amino acid transport system ATP-binding protein
VLAVMRDLAESGMTMLIVSHEIPFVRDVAHRVLFMDEGKIAEAGSPAELLASPKSARLQSFLRRFQAVFG